MKRLLFLLLTIILFPQCSYVFVSWIHNDSNRTVHIDLHYKPLELQTDTFYRWDRIPGGANTLYEHVHLEFYVGIDNNLMEKWAHGRVIYEEDSLNLSSPPVISATRQITLNDLPPKSEWAYFDSRQQIVTTEHHVHPGEDLNLGHSTNSGPSIDPFWVTVHHQGHATAIEPDKLIEIGQNSDEEGKILMSIILP